MLKFEYYLYNRETDRYIYSEDFSKLYETYNNLVSFEKVLGVSVLDEYGSTQISEILLEYKEL